MRHSNYHWEIKSFVDEKVTMNVNSYLSFLQRPCVAIFLQTFRFNSELNSGIPKHSSRGTQSASAVATKKINKLINHVYLYLGVRTDQGFLDPEIFTDSTHPHWHPAVGLDGESTRGEGRPADLWNRKGHFFWVCTRF